MAKEKEIKARIRSVSDTMQITKAMKLVSASTLKQARDQLERTLPYFEKIKTTIADILSHDIYSDNIYFDKRKKKTKKRNAYIIMTGDKGLCGGYNNNIFRFAERYLRLDNDPLLLVCGHTGAEYFKKKGYDLDRDFFYPVFNPNVFRAREMQERVMEMFKDERVDNIVLIYTVLENSFTLTPHSMRLLPLTFGSLRRELGIERIMERRYSGDLIYEPSIREVFEVLIPKYIKGVIYSALVEAFTSEQCARMIAMESATTNAEKMIKRLNLIYNRTRQNMITQEITEIIAGAQVLEQR